MKTTALFYIIIACFLLVSCDFPFNCLEGNGHTVREYRAVSGFTGVENNTSFDVEILKDTAFSLRVDADDNLLSSIKTDIEHGVLVIDTRNNRCFMSNNVNITILVPEVNSIESNGSGDMEVYDIETDFLGVKNSGSGDIEMTNIIANEIELSIMGSGSISVWGYADDGDYNVTGSGDINAQDMELGYCKATNSGSGDLYCNANDKLDITINGSGDVLYEIPDETVDISIDDDGSGDAKRVY